jgi:hypothetical protein
VPFWKADWTQVDLFEVPVRLLQSGLQPAPPATDFRKGGIARNRDKSSFGAP